MSFQPVSLALLAVFAGLSMNLMLQCGLGMRGIAVGRTAGEKPPLVKLCVMGLTVLLLWALFFYGISVLPLGFFMYLLLFPACALVQFSIEWLLYRFVLRKTPENGGPVNSHDGLAPAALFITLTVAEGFIEALVLSAGFALGILLAFVILGEIRRRAAMEAAPRFLRGAPLTLISMGLLSLIFSFAALIFFRAIGG